MAITYIIIAKRNIPYSAHIVKNKNS